METIRITHAQIEALMASPGSLEAIKTKLPVKPAYWLARAVVKMQDVYKTYKQEQQEVVKVHAVKNEKGKPATQPNGTVVWEPDQEEEAGQKLKDLAEIEVDLGIHPIDINPLPDTVSIESMILLMPLLKEIEEA